MARSKDFERLRAEWYQKLKDEGFDDIETFHTKDHYLLKRGAPEASRCIFKSTHISEYYRLASFFLHDFKWANEAHRHIWELHCEGLTIRRIEKLTGFSDSTVNRIIQAIVEGPFKSYASGDIPDLADRKENH